MGEIIIYFLATTPRRNDIIFCHQGTEILDFIIFYFFSVSSVPNYFQNVLFVDFFSHYFLANSLTSDQFIYTLALPSRDISMIGKTISHKFNYKFQITTYEWDHELHELVHESHEKKAQRMYSLSSMRHAHCLARCIFARITYH